jgi:hypothetical protein
VKVVVRCEFEVTVEVDESQTLDEVTFMIEENSCPGTGIVGAAVDAAMKAAQESGTCWACGLRAKNTITRVDPKLLLSRAPGPGH